jgi:phospholipid/cholesterol/gamma-HCH transport system ATP-binding protein
MITVRGWMLQCRGVVPMESELLAFEQVTCSTDSVALKTVSFQLNRGENIVVFGPESSGVDLVSPLIAGIIHFGSGDIYYKGKPIKNFTYTEELAYRKELGYLQKDYGLINNMTVEQNISLPLQYHSQLSGEGIRDVVDGFVRELNLEHCRDFRPVRLLRSEALKTAYARAIALDPDLLLFEHFLEGQCLINAQTVLKSIERRFVSGNKSVIFVTYEPERFVSFADRFLMLDYGAIVFMGTRDDFLRADNQYLAQYMHSSTEGPMTIL